MLEEIRKRVSDLLGKDTSGHGMDHINRVYALALRFAKEENANQEIVAMIALLHEVDDYKLFGEESAKNLANAKKIMKEVNVDTQMQEQILSEIKCLGYSKRLRGVKPNTLEGKIASDADMCDAMGATSIIRSYSYVLKNNRSFFDKGIFPTENMTAEQYTRKCSDSSVCHIFEKVLKLKDLMLTSSGKEEAKKRNQIVIDFLYHLFHEENVPEWTLYLDKYLNKDVQ